MRLFGLIGYPLSHSFSKKYFDEKFEKEGLTGCRFENFPIPSVDDFPGLVKSNPGLEGLAVTIPYKQEILRYVNDRTGIPVGLPACNCLKIRDKKVLGFNTDHSGFRDSLKPLLKEQDRQALVLGNGGATAAVVFVLKDWGIDFKIVSRRTHHGSSLTYKDLGEKIIKECTLIINTTPVGMYPGIDACPEIPYEFISGQHLLYDLIYNPAKTLFLKKGEERGARTKNGEEMLSLQAEENWRIWNQ